MSATEVAVPNAGGEVSQVITVTTNQPTWQAIAGADWVQTKQEGNNLIITASANPNTGTRTAEVGVYAGGATPQKVTVIQSAADIILEVSPAEIVVPNSGATKLVSVKSNIKDWSLEIEDSAKDWIKQLVFGDFVELEIAANEGEPRTAKIFATSGASQKEIVVNQAGIATTIFHTPLFEAALDQYKLLNYEKQQGSFMMDYLAPNPGLPSCGIPPTGAEYTFATSSPYFPSVLYSYEYNSNRLLYITYLSDKNTFKEVYDAGIVDFLKGLGFDIDEKDADSNVLTGVNKTTKFEVLVVEEEGKAAMQFIAPEPEQPGAMPSYAEFPLKDQVGHIFYLAEPGWKWADIKAYEEGKKTTPLDAYDETTELTRFSVQKDPVVDRGYLMNVNDENENPLDPTAPNYRELKRAIYYTGEIDKIFYVAYNQYYLTSEFKAMMEKEGYKFIAKQDVFFWFAHQNNIIIGVTSLSAEQIMMLSYRDDTSELFNKPMLSKNTQKKQNSTNKMMWRLMK